MTAQVWIAILVGLAAAADDLARRRIANWIPAAALAGGFGWQIGQNGVLTGSLHALGGTAVGFAVFLIFYLMGGMGGGDVKLMAGFGALLGLPGVLWAALWTAAFGGVIAIGAVAWQTVRGAGRRILRRTATISGGDREMQGSIPYAPAIVLGVWLALVPKG
jgi:prepilin peptidase CpaA